MEPATKKSRYFSTNKPIRSHSNSIVSIDSEEIDLTSDQVDIQINRDVSLLRNKLKRNHISITRYNGSRARITSFRLFNPPTPHFSGRRELLSTIHNRLTICATKTNFKERIIVIHGLGGIGKSDTVRKYLEIFIDDPIIQNCAWIDAESPLRLKSGFVSLAKALQLPTKERSVKNIIKDIYNHFSDHVGNGLIVFDNCNFNDQTQHGLLRFLPSFPLKRAPLILIIAQTGEREILIENNIQVNELSVAESVEVLAKQLRLSSVQLGNIDDVDSLEKLATFLQGYPLGLSLASACLENEEWNDLKLEIQVYLEAIQESKVEHCPVVAAASSNYQQLTSYICTATIRKILATEQRGDEIIQLLNLIAYMPQDDITTEYAGKVFEFAFQKKFPSEAFSTLFKYSLISMETPTTDHKNNDVRIKLPEPVQHYTRSLLQASGDLTCLTQYCLYLSNPKHISGSSHLRSMLQYLKKACCNSSTMYLQFSVIFTYRLIHNENESDEDRVWNILQQIYQFLNVNNSLHDHAKAHGLEDEVLNLFYLYLFYYQNNERYQHHEIFQDPQISKGTLRIIVMSAFKQYFRHLFPPQGESQVTRGSAGVSNSVSKVALDLGYQMCFKILNADCYYFEHDILEEAYEMFLNLVDTFGCGRLETVDQIYNILERYFNHTDAISSSDRYLNALLKIHNQTYSTIDLQSQEQLALYWKSGGPIFYGHVALRLQDEKHIQWSRSFADSFMSSNGPQILIEHLRYMSTYYDARMHHANCLSALIMRLAYAFGYGPQFIKTEGCLKHLRNLTVKILPQWDEDCSATSNSKRNDDPYVQFRVLLAWFGLFSKNEKILDNHGHFWSILSVADQLKHYLPYIVQKSNDDSWRNTNFWWLKWMTKDEQEKEVLRTFIKSTKNIGDEDEIAVASKTAACILELIGTKPVAPDTTLF